MNHQAVHTEHAPQAIGPYSQGVRSGDHLFLSGQIPLDPSTGTLVPGGVEEQTAQVMRNLQAVLNQAGGSLKHLVKTTIYLTDLTDFEAVNRVYGKFVVAPFPARATVQVAALPKGALVEIDGMAILPAARL